MPDAKPAAFPVAELLRFCRELFLSAGLDPEKAAAVAEILVEADRIGTSTHGLALAANYVAGIDQGLIAKSGEPKILSDRGACIAWDGERLPGAWLTRKAVDIAVERVPTYGTVTISIGNSHHIACLAAYLTRATDKGFVILLSSSSPAGSSVAPFGGTVGIYSPNPFAAGIPTSGDPILIDTSASVTTRNMSERLIREGRRFDYPWLMEADGTPTDDPMAIRRGGTILPAGGLDHGQKGYALALIIETLTQGLSGIGRADPTIEQSAATFLQVIDPSAFGGRPAFLHQLDGLAEACRSNPPRPGVDHVRLPGERALAARRLAETEGVVLHDGIFAQLQPLAARFGIALPDPLSV